MSIRYWGRKDGSLIEKYILSYSNIGDIILDPFAGSGNVLNKALELKRKAIYNDLDLVAQIIAKANILRKETNVELNKRYLDLYMINGEEVNYYIWEGNEITKAKMVNGKLIDYHGKDYEGEIPYPYPQDPLVYSNGESFEKNGGVTRIDQLFTRRNILILSDILDQLPREEKALATFISTLHDASKMVRSNGGVWGIPNFWIPYKRVEKNPYRIFERRLKILNKVGGNWIEGGINDVLNGNSDIAFINFDAKKLPIPDNSADLIITDPPFFDEIQYFEIYYFYAVWLNIRLNFDNEIIVNHKRGFNIKKYLNDLEKAVSEMYRILKKNRKIIIMFHEENEEKMKEMKEIISSFFIIEKEDTSLMRQRNIGHRGGRELKIIIGRF